MDARLRTWMEEHKPAAPERVHLLLAALMWTIVGSVLLAVGVMWLLPTRAPWVWMLVGGSVAAGVAKGHFALSRAARRIIERIRARGEGRCIGGFLSMQTWGLVAIMAIGGRLLRGSVVPKVIVGFAYAAVGAALLVACRHFWRAWRENRRPRSDAGPRAAHRDNH